MALLFACLLPFARKSLCPMELVIMSEPVKNKSQLHASLLVFVHKGQH
jgi:hypothetical protein